MYRACLGSSSAPWKARNPVLKYEVWEAKKVCFRGSLCDFMRGLYAIPPKQGKKFWQTLFLQSLFKHCSEKKVAFKLSKSQIQLKIKQSSSLELRSVHYWANTSAKNETAQRIKIRIWEPRSKKSSKLLPQIGSLSKLVL